MAKVDQPHADDVASAPIDELGTAGFALAMQMLRNREDAADAVQDSLCRLLRKRRLFDPSRGRLRSWFLKIVRNRCVDVIRRRSRRLTESIESHEPATSPSERPDVVVEQREMLDLLKSQLMEMPGEQRELLLLRDFHDLSYAEVAHVLSIPVGTVMSRLHRARMELRRRMQTFG